MRSFIESLPRGRGRQSGGRSGTRRESRTVASREGTLPLAVSSGCAELIGSVDRGILFLGKSASQILPIVIHCVSRRVCEYVRKRMLYVKTFVKRIKR